MRKGLKYLLLISLTTILCINFTYCNSLQKGKQYFQQGRYKEARVIFEKIIKDKLPKSDEAQFMIGKCYYYQGLFVPSVTNFKKVIRDYPASKFKIKAMLWIGSSYFHLKKDYRKAIEKYQEVVNKYPETEEAIISQFQVGRCYRKLKRYKEAIETFERIKKKYPDNKEYIKQAEFEINLTQNLMK